MGRLNRHASSIGCALVFGATVIHTAPAADAGERITPWSVVAGDEHVVCLVNNVSKTTRTVIIEIRAGGANPAGADCITENPVSAAARLKHAATTGV